MEASKTIVAVAGATGRTGSLIVKELFQKGYRVRGVVRSLARGAWIQDLGGEIVEADITSPESVEHAVEGVDFLISALGSTKPFSPQEDNRVDNMGNQNLARAAKKKGIKHIVVVSSIGVGNSSSGLPFLLRLLMGPVLRTKAKSEAAIISCGVGYTIIRPGALTDKAVSGNIAFGEGGKINGKVSRADIARVCVDGLSNQAMKNRVLEVVDAATVKEALRPFIIKI
ncbi:MAG: SDR family oxidoreductase, partial [Proteobacteria bacterium]|nr:SDR family oxidoreductase [Pseudomonadota bacterium]